MGTNYPLLVSYVFVAAMSRARSIPRFSLSLLLLCLCSFVDAEPTEGAPVFFAHELLEKSLLVTDYYRIASLVEVKAFSYEFTVHTDHGKYKVQGRKDLYKLLHELKVIDRLEEVSQTEAFANSLTTSVSSPVMTTYGVARRPIATVSGLPLGVVRYLGGKFYQIRRESGKAVGKIRDFADGNDKEKAEPEKERSEEEDEGLMEKANELGRRHLGHDSARRKWARRLEVDPYSDNIALQEELARIAWASSLGKFAGGFAMPSGDLFSYAGKTQELVWDRPAHQLLREMESFLGEIGIEKDWIVAFRDSPSYSLTEKTDLCIGFKRLTASGSVPTLIEFGLQVDSKEEAAFFMRTVKLLVEYNDEVAQIASISIKRGLIVANSRNGYEVYPLAVDYLHWTPLVYEALLDEEIWAEQREVWVAGKVSPVAKMRLRHNGWEVFDEVEDHPELHKSLSKDLAASR